MKNKSFTNYYLLSIIGVLIISFYPLYMGLRVVEDMIVKGSVKSEDYPKYIIPYTPIALAVIIGVLLMPLMMKLFKKLALLPASAVAVGVFLTAELMLESMVIVEESRLADWQMYMCVSPVYGSQIYETVRLKALDILVGDYNPWFKLHFYVISFVIILSFLNCIYGFGYAVKNKVKDRLKPLILQSIASVMFLALCIFACFTAFFRDGTINISLLSAFLMGVFFVVFGVTMGIYTGSFLCGKSKGLSLLLPSIIAMVTTLVMYIGEYILLDSRLYKVNVDSVFFNPLRGNIFAPYDVLIILLSGSITALVLYLVADEEKIKEES